MIVRVGHREENISQKGFFLDEYIIKFLKHYKINQEFPPF
jgi:hypothetical protein